ncbi:hypothetical protein [Motilimonas pumila]|uniref:Uncharacterized protein n=1 Tax=Motilimonas pumila TaxID=2303987 RepID=A0A418Y8Z9_9GAMM|nr:hypothetical protein [Motilimonas pumila]RJG35908.1 hypothetical protein D1Z90_20690 [Motilimonas pumila]
MIVEAEKRKGVLVDAGVPEEFLSAIDSPNGFEDLEFIAKAPDGFYFYLPSVFKNYEILKGYEVTPIYEGSNGDTYYVLLTRGQEVRFVHFELEQDAIYSDYGAKFRFMLADFLIDYYEFATEVSIGQLSDYGVKLGFERSKALFEALEHADENGMRKTFELDKKWRKENLPQFVE